MPSLCLFAFPLCDKRRQQPKQICRLDCKQLQQDICKDEYLNMKTLFDNKITDNLQQQASSFLLDCNQLPPSSDLTNECLPIISMTLDKIESSLNRILQPSIPQNFDSQSSIQKCITGNGVDYRGIQSYSRSGKKCLNWDDQLLQSIQFNPELSGHNYCRNPDNDVEPWCFTMSPDRRKEYCGISKCGMYRVYFSFNLFFFLIFFLIF